MFHMVDPGPPCGPDQPIEPEAGGADEAGRGFDVRVLVGVAAGLGFGFAVAVGVGLGVGFGVAGGVVLGVGVALALPPRAAVDVSPVGPIQVTLSSVLPAASCTTQSTDTSPEGFTTEVRAVPAGACGRYVEPAVSTTRVSPASMESGAALAFR